MSDNKEKEITMLNYFGTNTTQAGHYFFTLREGFHSGSGLEGSVKLNPEGLIKGIKDGYMNLVTINGLNIIAIAGSPIDKRGGCKSVFWHEKGTRFNDLKEAILRLPASLILLLHFLIGIPFIVWLALKK